MTSALTSTSVMVSCPTCPSLCDTDTFYSCTTSSTVAEPSLSSQVPASESLDLTAQEENPTEQLVNEWLHQHPPARPWAMVEVDAMSRRAQTDMLKGALNLICAIMAT